MALPDRNQQENLVDYKTELGVASPTSGTKASLINAIEELRAGKRMKGTSLNPKDFSNRQLEKMLRDLERAAEQRSMEDRPGGEPLLLAHGGRVTKRAMMTNKRKKTRKNKVYANGGGVRRAKYNI